MNAGIEVYSYLSVLVSIVIGLGMSQILAGVVRVLHRRRTGRIYGPTMVWGVNLFVLLTLIWWSDFSLIHHGRWTFAMFLATLALPALLYINASLILPGSERAADEPMRLAYADNRKPFFTLQSLAVAASFLETYLTDGYVKPDVDAALKLVILVVGLVPIFVKAEWVQWAVAVVTLVWLLFYVSLLFANVRTS
jgi:hypothetical protein